jgi:hypothetical protein
MPLDARGFGWLRRSRRRRRRALGRRRRRCDFGGRETCRNDGQVGVIQIPKGRREIGGHVGLDERRVRRGRSARRHAARRRSEPDDGLLCRAGVRWLGRTDSQCRGSRAGRSRRCGGRPRDGGRSWCSGGLRLLRRSRGWLRRSRCDCNGRRARRVDQKRVPAFGAAHLKTRRWHPPLVNLVRRLARLARHLQHRDPYGITSAVWPCARTSGDPC